MKYNQKIQFTVKYGFDFIMALMLLIPLSIFIMILGLILYMDSPGPIFFKQLRLGKGGRLFTIFKLRTMVPGDHTRNTPRNPDGSLSLTSQLNGYTRFGKILRRFSLDELPQLYNVLGGQMSFIGPRPDLPEHLAMYSELETVKLQVRPGLTGLAQIKGRNELPWRERLKLDAQYVNDYWLGLDCYIFFSTVGRIISGRGIYQ